MQPQEELQTPLLSAETSGNLSQQQDAPPTSSYGDLEQGHAEVQPLVKKPARRSLHGWITRHAATIGYFQELFSLAIFFWSIVADCLFLKELYQNGYMKFATAATVFVASPHVVMSMLLVLRQGWVSAAGQSCTFIAALNPLESISPVPGGCFGVLTVALAYMVYTVIAVSGLLFVMYCLFCYLVIALIFSLLILDLAMLVVAVAPSKRIFKYTDLVYLENFKFSRLVVQCLLESIPQLVLLATFMGSSLCRGFVLPRICRPILLQVVLAHSFNVADKMSMFMEGCRTAGSGVGWHLIYSLMIKGGWKVSPPVLDQNLDNMLRGNHMLHIASQQSEEEHEDEDNAPSVVPEYLTPSNGSWLSPGQTMKLLQHAFRKFSGPSITDLMLEVSSELPIAKALQAACGRFPHLNKIRLQGAFLGGAQAKLLPRVLSQFKMLTKIQIYQTNIDVQGALSLANLLQCSYTLSHLEICKCRMPAKGVCHLAAALKLNHSLHQLSLAHNNMHPSMTVKFVDMLCFNKSLQHLNLAFNQFDHCTGQRLMQALQCNVSLLQLVLAYPDLGQDLTKAMVDYMQGNAVFELQRLERSPESVKEKASSLEARNGAVFFDDATRLMRGSASESVGGQRRSDKQGDFLVPTGLDGQGSIMLGVVDKGIKHGLQMASKPKACALECHLGAGRVPIQGLPQMEFLCVQDEEGFLNEWWDMPPICNLPFSTSSPSLSPYAHTVADPSTSTSVYEPQPSHADEVSPSSSAPGISCLDPGCSEKENAGSYIMQHDCASKILPLLTLVVPQDQIEQIVMKAPLFISNLISLDVSELDIGDDGAKTIAQVLEQVENLESLNLARNSIGDVGIAYLTDALRKNTCLTKLNLSSNEMGDGGALALAEALKVNKTLTELILKDNQFPFSLETLRAFLKAIRENSYVNVELVDEASALQKINERRGDDSSENSATSSAEANHSPSLKLTDEATDTGAQSSFKSVANAERSVEEEHRIADAKRTRHASNEESAREISSSRSGGSAEDVCGICFDNPTVVAIRRCGHAICVNCYREVCHLRPNGALCPFCRSIIAGYSYLRWPSLD